MNRLFRFDSVLVLCCVALLLFGLHANVGQARLVPTATRVTAHWEPGTESWLQLPRNAPQYADLFDLKPAHAFQLHSNDVFGVFLPPGSDSVAGDVWPLDARQMLPFLRQFHPGATVSLSGQQGAYACLRAASSEYYEIVFQFHADFDLEILETATVLPIVQEQLKKELEEERIASLKQQVEEIGKLQGAIEESRFEGLRAGTEEKIGAIQERIQTLDTADDLAHLKKELAEAVAALTEVTTSLEALSGDLETRLDELKTTITALEELLSNFDARLDALKKELTAHFDTRLNALEKVLTAHFDARLDEFEQELTTNLNARFDRFEQQLTAKVDAEFSTLQQMLTAQERTLTQRLNTLLTAEVAKLKGLRAYNEGIYLMPKQFKGRLLISKSGGEIVAFTIECPAQDENATLFIFGDRETVSMPRMALIAGDFDKHDITWTNAITAEEADEALRLRFAARKSHMANPTEAP